MSQRLPSPPARIVRARIGVFGTFFMVGFVMASWLVNIPAVQAATGISHTTLGGLLLILGAGGVIGMQVAGVVISRIGSKRVAIAAFIVYVLAVNLPVHATGPLGLALSLGLFGLATGTVDVAMNDQAVIVERGYGRPIMSAFHAFWSLGGAAGALLGATAERLTLPTSTAVLSAAVLAAIGAAAVLPQLLPNPAPSLRAEPAQAGPRKLDQQTRRKVLGFAVLAFLLFLAEGVANDWSALHAVEHLGQPRATAALGYATFAVAMTAGRLTIDRIAHRFGPRFVIRYGSAAAALGLLTVIVSPWFPLTLVGWAVFGLGLAGVVPQLFTAAGNISGSNQSILLSRVVGAGYVGQLAGPAIVGAAAGFVGLNLAFALPLLFCIAAVVAAPIVSARRVTVTDSLDGEQATAEDIIRDHVDSSASPKG